MGKPTVLIFQLPYPVQGRLSRRPAHHPRLTHDHQCIWRNGVTFFQAPEATSGFGQGLVKRASLAQHLKVIQNKAGRGKRNPGQLLRLFTLAARYSVLRHLIEEKVPRTQALVQFVFAGKIQKTHAIQGQLLQVNTPTTVDGHQQDHDK